MPRRMAYDRWLFFTALLLVVGGLFMVGSSSNYTAMDFGKSPSAFYVKHGLHVLLGFCALVAALSFPYQRLDQRALITLMFLGCVAALIVRLSAPGGVNRPAARTAP